MVTQMLVKQRVSFLEVVKRNQISYHSNVWECVSDLNDNKIDSPKFFKVISISVRPVRQ